MIVAIAEMIGKLSALGSGSLDMACCHLSAVFVEGTVV
jgi:hypothetical protein